MQVGVNYPWFDYGWDFGQAPPGWRRELTVPRWFTAIDDHLRRFQALGITVVRWFILADGLTYGAGGAAPVPDAVAGRRWHFAPPPLDSEFLGHFEELLARFAAAQSGNRAPIQLLPVLLDFHFCEQGIRPVQEPRPADPALPIQAPGWVKQGRADVLTDSVRRTQFLNEVLDPLLRASSRTQHVIYAWELINEPDWVTKGWHPWPLAGAPVPPLAMRAFLEEGNQRIRRAGFKSTIGFGSIHALRHSGITIELNQFHHYPNGADVLDRHTFDTRCPGIIGEFATAERDVWPDLAGGAQGVLHRLRLACARGYPLAVPWSFLARDRHTDWSATVEREIALFTYEQGR